MKQTLKIISNGRRHIRLENESIRIVATYYHKLGDNHGSGWDVSKFTKGKVFWQREYTIILSNRFSVKKHLKQVENINL